MMVKWPIIPIIDQRPISRLHNLHPTFYVSQKENETRKVPRIKWPGKRRGKGLEKNSELAIEKVQILAYVHAPD